MSNLEEQIKQMIIDSLDLEDMSVQDIDTDIPLFADGLGLDSIDALELGISIHKQFGVKIDANDTGAKEHFRSVATLARFIRQHGYEEKK
ncbi:MAG TPA: phosphopantetheine-binding protein [Pseudomonadales bacterium]|nr:phosphopantetheine-binding protein [Pseudomonadales bacterium]